MKKLTIILTALMLVLTAIAPATAQSSGGKAADCSTYDRNRAESEGSSGGGALFGAIIGGSKGAKRGAALGGGLGAIGGGIRGGEAREARYRYYCEACMRGEVR